MELRSLGLASFGAATLAWLLLAGLLTVRRSDNRTGRLLLAAVVVQVLWAGMLTLALVPWAPALPAASLLEAARPLAWVVLLLQLLGGTATPAPDDDPLERTRRLALALVASLAAVSVAADFLGPRSQLAFTVKTLLAVTGLVCLEQVYRNTGAEHRWSLKFLAIALAALFSFDLLLYSDAMLFSQVNPSWWVARGFANALLVPLIAIAAARNPQWKLDIAVSRSVVFHSAALFGAGAYLLVFAGVGYYVRFFGGEWGEIAQTLVLFGAAIGLLIVLMSGTLRARLRVFLSKHFFSYRFDYREQWLRLTRALSTRGSDGPADDLPHRALRALAHAVESRGGALWLREGDTLHCTARLNYRGPRDPIDAAEPLVGFLEEREWVIDLDEWRNDRTRYDGLALPAALAAYESGWIVVPLILDRDLLGLVLLEHPLAPLVLDWEVRDLLKAAARQAASYLGVQRAVEQLVQAQQFESFNRMSAFVVHDLKNLVAQLSLMLRNAQRHRDNPEFQADMLSTVENVIDRMQGLLLQLRVGARPVEQPAPVPVADALTRAVARRGGLQPEPSVEIDPSIAGRAVLAHTDRLERVIGHLLQNAADAVSASGIIRVRARCADGQALIEVEDNGKGMSEEFVRTKLFRPFSSTKAHGMGIGTFESREYVRELGGSLEVESREGSGTTFRIQLPLVADAAMSEPAVAGV
ncbi:MAG TPA: XrtA/PEP-CTERM system histidine kinase PrsK [Zeimonas sp.]|nr:XrtA/PEP-CTERM system histidine kinase PrsK [Zeimonas sp.]